MIFVFLEIVEGGDPLINVIMRVYFDGLGQTSRFKFCP